MLEDFFSHRKKSQLTECLRDVILIARSFALFSICGKVTR